MVSFLVLYNGIVEEFPLDQEVRITLRLPQDLRDRIRTLADGRKSSLNQMIVDALETAFPDEKAHLRNALRTIMIEIDRETDPERRERLIAARKQLVADLFFEHPLPPEKADLPEWSGIASHSINIIRDDDE